MNEYAKLRVWQDGRDVASDVYLLTETLPDRERYGLQAQMRRSAVSIPSNIAEGAGRSGRRDFARFIEMASGSAAELETQLLIAGDVGLVTIEEATRAAQGVRAFRFKLERLRRRLTGDPKGSPPIG